MHTHANARLTQKGRLRLVSGHLNDHRPLAELAAEAGISLRCAYKWLARYPRADSKSQHGFGCGLRITIASRLASPGVMLL